jgi:adenylate cyclase
MRMLHAACSTGLRADCHEPARRGILPGLPEVPFRGISPMKRKIAAIMAADVAGYSRLVADDEEETLRRLAAYREVVDDFIARSSGRIFSTAGDAVLAEFSSAVEAVRCAIDIQESLRTRNLAYPPSRQMSFRIGITIGDVVERDADLLGDGVNIAARLESIAPVGGICVSRNVFEQVSNKLSVH